MNLHCVIPKANFNEEKQTLLVAYCALVCRPIPIFFKQSSGYELSKRFCAFLFKFKVSTAQISVIILS